jgi:hypothetical protein
MKNSKRSSPLRPFFQSYSHFIGIVAYGMVHTRTSNDGILTRNFAHIQLYLSIEYPENFSLKECFLPEI